MAVAVRHYVLARPSSRLQRATGNLDFVPLPERTIPRCAGFTSYADRSVTDRVVSAFAYCGAQSTEQAAVTFTPVRLDSNNAASMPLASAKR